MKCDKVLPSAEKGGISMAVYIGLITIGAAMTIETLLRHALLRRWYDLFLALPVWLGWFLAAAALYFLLLYLLSLTVDKAKPEIFDIPITGSVVHKCFFLSIDREDNRKALGTILRAAALRRCCGMAPCPSAFTRRGRAAKWESFSPFATAHFKSQSGQARPS